MILALKNKKKWLRLISVSGFHIDKLGADFSLEDIKCVYLGHVKF